MADSKTWRMFIGGDWTDSSRGETEPDINPATGDSVATIQVGTREDADRAVAAAQKAYDDVWFDTPPKERAAMMLKLADALDADVDGEVGDADPALAVEDVLLRGEAFEAIVLSTLPPGPSRWLRLDLPHRLEGKTGLRVIHVIGHPEPAAAGSG